MFQIITILFSLIPLPAFAQCSSISKFSDLEPCVFSLVNAVVPVLIGLALAAFVWGLAQSILYSENAETRRKGKIFMIYGLISLFVIVGIWGILALVRATFGV